MFARFSVLVCLLGVLWLAGCTASPPAAEEQAQAPPATPRAECRWATARLKIDGVPDEIVWDKAQLISEFAVFWDKRKPKTDTKARLLWDAQALYFCAEMEDSDLYADVTRHNGMTWLNDVFELFFKPAADKTLYYEFQVNAANTRLELLLPSRGAGGYMRFAPLTDLGMEHAVKLQGTLNKWEDKDTGWMVEGRIPWKAFDAAGGRPKAGDKWRFALCRYDYSVAFERTETSSSAPLTVADFHRYEDYGELTFVGP